MQKSFFGGHLTKTAIAKGLESESDKFYITGVMSSPNIDLENEVIDPKAYQDAIDKVKSRFKSQNPIKLFLEHRRKELSIPLGAVEDAWASDKGLMFKARIANSSITTPIKELIREGVLQGVSIGGECLKAIPYFDPKLGKDIKKIVKMDLRELSLTGLPVNEDAIFSMSKSLHCSGKCDSNPNSISKSCKTCGPNCFKNHTKEVKFLVGKLNKAISTEKSIQTLEKAAQMAEEGKAINPEDAKRIEDALKNLGGLLGIELGSSAGAGTPEEGVGLPPAEETPPAEGAPPEGAPPEGENPDGGVAPEENIQEQEIPQPKPNVKPKPAPTAPTGALEYTEEEDAVADEDADDGMKALENTEMGDSQEIEQKLDKILELLSSKDEGEVDSEFNEDVENVEDEDNSNTEEGGEKMDNATHCKKCQLTFNKSQVDYDVNFCPICGDTIGEPVERVVSKSCPECKNTFTKSFDIDADAALEAEYDLCFCPQCGAKLIAGKAKEEQGEELIEEGAQEIAEGNEGETPAEEASEIATPEKEDEDIDLDGESDDEDLMIDLDKALASIAVATSPKGAKTVRDGKYPDKTPAAKTSYPSKDVKGLGSVKVADSPDGAKTKFTTKAQKKADLLKNLEVETGSHDGDSGPAINDFDDKYVDPSTGERTDSADSTLHEQSEAYFQPMEGGASEAKWKNYEQDRKMKKSALEDEVSSLRKSIDELKSVATRRGIVTNTLMAPEVAPTQEALDRHLAQVFTGKLKG